jgi:hypothetical protein
MAEISLADAIAQSLAAVEVLDDEDVYEDEDEDEEETEEVLVCKYCGNEDGYATENGSASYTTNGMVKDNGWGLYIEAWDTEYESEETDEYETDCCGSTAGSLDALFEYQTLPVDR